MITAPVMKELKNNFYAEFFWVYNEISQIFLGKVKRR